MSKKKSKSKSSRLQKYKGLLSNLQKRCPKWKLLALGIIAIIALVVILAVVFWPSNEATTARDGDTVKVAYIGSYDNGSVFDSANASAPLEFTIGNSSMITGFEKGVIGMSVEQTKTIRLAPEDAYGPAEFIESLDSFPPNTNVAVGQYYNITRDGVYIEARVTAVEGDTITMQNMNKMAGQYLNFEITLVELIKAVKPATNTSG
jgi:FKBP-type peptidyl-prolyl cis-trans isomerase 2